MGRRDRAWPHHLGSLTGFCSARPQARKKFSEFVDPSAERAHTPLRKTTGTLRSKIGSDAIDPRSIFGRHLTTPLV
jgi:hypothetical protein